MKTRISEDKKTLIMQDFAAGKTVAEISSEHGVSTATLYKWNPNRRATARKALRSASVSMDPMGSLDPMVKLKLMFADAMIENADLRGKLSTASNLQETELTS